MDKYSHFRPILSKHGRGGWTYYDPLVFSNLPTYSEGLKFHAKRWKMPRWMTLQVLKSTTCLLISVSSKQSINAIHRIVFIFFSFSCLKFISYQFLADLNITSSAKHEPILEHLVLVKNLFLMLIFFSKLTYQHTLLPFFCKP